MLHYLDLRSYSKSKLELESNLSESYQLIASLFVVLLQLNLIKLKLECLRSGFKCKNRKRKTYTNFFASLEFDFFRVQLKFAFRIRR